MTAMHRGNYKQAGEDDCLGKAHVERVFKVVRENAATNALLSSSIDLNLQAAGKRTQTDLVPSLEIRFYSVETLRSSF